MYLLWVSFHKLAGSRKGHVLKNLYSEAPPTYRLVLLFFFISIVLNLEAFLADHDSVDFENNGNYYDFDDDESEHSEPSDNKVPAEKRIIGSELSDIYYGGSTEWDDDVLEGFADEVLGTEPVHWLTEPGNQQLQVNFIAVSTVPYVRALSPICTCCSESLTLSWNFVLLTQYFSAVR